MKLPPYVKRRGNVYWFRRRVPDELIPLVGRGEFSETLKTTELEVARTRAAFRNAEVEAVFERARYQRQSQLGTALAEIPTPEQQQYIRDAVRAHLLDEDEGVRLARPGEDDLEGYDDYRSNEYETVADGLRTGRVAWGAQEKAKMGKLLAAIGVQVEPGTPAWDLAAYRAAEGLYAALQDIAKRSSESHVPTPMRPPLPSSLMPATPVSSTAKPSKRNLGDVIDYYVGVWQTTTSAVRLYGACSCSVS